MRIISEYIGGAEEKYPKELLNGRKTIEGNVVSCIWCDPLLLDEAKLETRDFLTADGAYYFSLARQLREKGFSSFDEVTVLSNISEEIEIGFTQRGGWDSVQHLIDIINTKNWDTYIDILYRENIIINLYNNGFNLLKPIEDKNKTIIPLKLFRHMDSESVIEWYESRVTSFGTGYTSKVLEDEEIDFDDKFFEDCENGVENGVPFSDAGLDINGETMNCFPFLSEQIKGLMPGTTSIFGGYSSVGKSTAWCTILMALMHNDKKVLLISNEQKCKAFKTNFVVWVLYKHFRYYSLTRSKLKSGSFNDEEKGMLQKAQTYWRENFKGKIRFVEIADADMALIKKLVRGYVLNDGYDAVLYDTFKLDFNKDKDSKEYVSLLKDSRELDEIAKKYNIIMLCSLQLAEYTKGKLFLDASVLSMSKQIKEVCENLLLMRTVYDEELDEDNKKYFCKPFQLKKIDNKWAEVPYTADRTKTWRMLFVEKNRNGNNSSDTGVAYLMAYNGAHGIIREVAQARPHHGYIQ